MRVRARVGVRVRAKVRARVRAKVKVRVRARVRKRELKVRVRGSHCDFESALHIILSLYASSLGVSDVEQRRYSMLLTMI